MNDLLAFADEIRELYRDNEYLRSEVERLAEYERKYHELLDQSVKHGEQMMVGWLDLLLSKKVTITDTNASPTV